MLEVDASLAEIAEEVGCSKALAGYWRQGAKLPSSTLRDRLLEAYDIPPASWELAPGAEAEAEPALPVLVDVDDDADTLTLTKARLASIRQELRSSKLSESARSKKQDTEAKLLALKARLERDDDEDRFVRGPKWKLFKERLLGALKTYPDAAKAVAEALQETEG